jgi:hypothetical protein
MKLTSNECFYYLLLFLNHLDFEIENFLNSHILFERQFIFLQYNSDICLKYLYSEMKSLGN